MAKRIGNMLILSLVLAVTISPLQGFAYGYSQPAPLHCMHVEADTADSNMPLNHAGYNIDKMVCMDCCDQDCDTQSCAIQNCSSQHGQSLFLPSFAVGSFTVEHDPLLPKYSFNHLSKTIAALYRPPILV